MNAVTVAVVVVVLYLLVVIAAFGAYGSRVHRRQVDQAAARRRAALAQASAGHPEHEPAGLEDFYEFVAAQLADIKVSDQ